LPPTAYLHIARKSFISTALDLGLPPIEIKRYVGHELEGLIFKIYSQSKSEKGLREVARGFKYGKSVEKALVSCLTGTK